MTGVVHAAGVLADATLHNQTLAVFDRACSQDSGVYAAEAAQLGHAAGAV